MRAFFLVCMVALVIASASSVAQAETLFFSFTDRIQDAWGCSPSGPCSIPFSFIETPVTDVVGLFFSFDNVTGDYVATMTASPANPFIGYIVVNVHLFNASTGYLFSDDLNSFFVNTPTTSITLTGQNPQLRTWRKGDRVAVCEGSGGIIPETCSGGLGSTIAFSSGVINLSSPLSPTDPVPQTARDAFQTSPPATIATADEFVQSLLSTLIGEIAGLNLPAKISNSFSAKLAAALLVIHLSEGHNEFLAVNILHGFINEVDAQRGKHLTGAQADYLISSARRIIRIIKLE